MNLGEDYHKRRAQLHDCRGVILPRKMLQSASTTTGSTLDVFPPELFQHIKHFLNFRGRCCLALTNKTYARLLADTSFQSHGYHGYITITNIERKEIYAHPPPNKISLSIPPLLISTHVCGEYHDLLRVIAKDWNSARVRLCMRCDVFRSREKVIWDRRILKCKDTMLAKAMFEKRGWLHDLYIRDCKEWCEGVTHLCPDCTSRARLHLTRDIDLIKF